MWPRAADVPCTVKNVREHGIWALFTVFPAVSSLRSPFKRLVAGRNVRLGPLVVQIRFYVNRANSMPLPGVSGIEAAQKTARASRTASWRRRCACRWTAHGRMRLAASSPRSNSFAACYSGNANALGHITTTETVCDAQPKKSPPQWAGLIHIVGGDMEET